MRSVHGITNAYTSEFQATILELLDSFGPPAFMYFKQLKSKVEHFFKKKMNIANIKF